MKKFTTGKVYWEIPSTIDLEAFLKKYPPNFVAKPKIDYFYSIIEHLSKGMEEQDLNANEGFVNTNAKKMQNFNQNYKLYLDHLLNNKFIRTDMKYIVGKKSKGFIINKYNGHKAEVKKIPVIDYVARKNKIKELELKKTYNKNTTKNYRHLTKWFNSKLQIDVVGAKKMIEEMYPEQTGGIRGTVKRKPSIWAKRYKAIYSINKFSNQEFYYNVDETVGRFHSNLTNIKREIRNFITYDGKKLVNIDIKNAQPLFSTLLLNKQFYKTGVNFLNFFTFPSFLHLLIPLKSSKISHTISPLQTPYSTTIIMLVENLKNLTDKGFGDYEEFVNSGDFYKKLADRIYPDKAYVKKNMKSMVFTIFFSSNRFIGQKEAQPKRDFREHFPNVYELFRLIKVKNHNALAHLLQRIESAIMIGAVSSRIALENPNLPFFTIHDSIATIEGNEDYVANIIKEEALRLTGLNVKLGFEKWY